MEAARTKPLRKARGFTFLELILVLLIISVAMAIVGPAVGNRFTTGDPRRTARQLRAAMELMRIRAVQRGQEEILVVDPDTNSYRSVHGGESAEVPSEGGQLSGSSRWTGDQGEAEFRFYPDGTNSGGEVRIEKRQGVELTTYVVSLDSLLGTATIWLDE
jgi:general secretion pathway protein H